MNSLRLFVSLFTLWVNYSYGALPFAFEANRGQTDPSVQYFARNGDAGIWLTSDGAVLGKHGIQSLRLRMIGSRAPSTVTGLQQLQGKANYFIGNDPAKWRTNIPLYGRVIYNDVYPGVDVAYYGNEGRFEYDFELAPGANPSVIRVAHEGARRSHLNESGDLVLITAAGEVTMKKPVAYQMIDGNRKEIAVRYDVRGEQVQFALSRYDKRQKLVIDPVVVYSYSIAGRERGPAGIAVDGTGATYLTGFTSSASFPVVQPAGQPTLVAQNGNSNAFVAKLNPQGTALLYATYLGGTIREEGAAIAVDGNGSAWVCGITHSNDFPLQSPVQNVRRGPHDAFVTKLSPSGNALQFSTYLGGDSQDNAVAIAVDGTGRAYVAGQTQSPNFPTVNALQPLWGGNNDIFVARFTSAGALSYSTYFGGSGGEAVGGMAVDANGAVFLSGGANSLPVVNGLPGVAVGIEGGVFVSQINAAGTGLVYSTYLGTAYATAVGVAIDSAGAAYVVGTLRTNSQSYLLKLNPQAAGIGYSVRLTNGSGPRAVAADASGATYVSNCVYYGAAPFGFQIYSLKIEKWNAAGTARLYTHLFPTNSCESESGGIGDPITVDATGAAYVFSADGVVTKLTPALTAPVQLTTSVTPAGCGTVQASPTAGDNSDGFYQNGTTVLLTAAGNNCVFTGWSGDLSGTTNPQSLVMSAPRSVTAQFAGCAVGLTPSGTIAFPATGGIQPVIITTSESCAWTVTSSVPWIIPGTSAGSGAGTTVLTVAGNPGTFARSGQVTVGATTITINQDGGPACVFTLNPTSLQAPATGATGIFTVVTSLPTCNWTAGSSDSWVVLGGTLAGTGNGLVTYTVLPKTDAGSRTAMLNIAGNNVTVQQAGPFTNTSGLRFLPLAPCRIADTRASGGKAGDFGPPVLFANGTRNFPIVASGCGVPANVRAYSLNITAIPPGFLSYITVFPTGNARPLASTLNSWNGRVVANAAIVPAGTDGQVSIFSSDPTDLVIDINGVFVPNDVPDGLMFYPVTPCRVADTRPDGGKQPLFGPPTIAQGTGRTFPIPQSGCGIPTSARAYSINVTAVPQGFLAFVTVSPSGQPRPLVSTLNSWDGQVVPNAAIVPAGTNGGIDVYASNTTDIVVDINGYFAPPTPGGLQFYPSTPCRIADTRNAAAPFGGPILFGRNIRDFAIPQSACNIPSTAQAYSLNLTAVPPDYLGFVTVWPFGAGQPFVSTLNSWNGQVVANAAIVPAGVTGAISFYASNPTELVIDTNGYFAP